MTQPTLDDAIPLVAGAATARPPIELGFVLAGRLDSVDLEAIELARRQVQEDLRQWFPEFQWRLTTVAREEIPTQHREEPVHFLQQGQTERDIHKWDFVFVLTRADLIGHDKPFALAVVSRTLDLAILSTSRIDPRAVDSTIAREVRVERLRQRLHSLVLRCLGHLNGLETSEESTNLMWDADSVEELDGMSTWTDEQRNEMRTNLLSTADLRMEEREPASPRYQMQFLLRAAWNQRREILGGVLQAAPWRFPYRLSRLTTAAFSAMLVLLMTAETWDVSTSQSPAAVSLLLLAAMVLTTVYVVRRQQLLVRRHDRLLTEQIAVSNVTATATVFCGMLTTLVAVLVVSLSLGLLLFPRSLVEDWVGTRPDPIVLSHYLLVSSVVSALSIAIGALGAAFEDQTYFRHVTFVDIEV